MDVMSGDPFPAWLFFCYVDTGDKKEGKMITLIALVKAKEGMEETVKQELLSLVKPTRSEPGCISYDVHQATDDKSLFVFYEIWKTVEDLEKHREMPHLKAFKQKADSLLAKPIEVTLLKKIS
jgi:quinol monooxygenase YgiN